MCTFRGDLGRGKFREEKVTGSRGCATSWIDGMGDFGGISRGFGGGLPAALNMSRKQEFIIDARGGGGEGSIKEKNAYPSFLP